MKGTAIFCTDGPLFKLLIHFWPRQQLLCVTFIPVRGQVCLKMHKSLQNWRSQTLGEQSDGYGMLLPASKRHTAIMVCVTGWVF